MGGKRGFDVLLFVAIVVDVKEVVMVDVEDRGEGGWGP